MIKLSSSYPFDDAFAQWRGDAPVGPTKAPARASDDDLDAAFAEWQDVSFDQLVDQMSAALVAEVDVDFDDLITEELPIARLRRAS